MRRCSQACFVVDWARWRGDEQSGNPPCGVSLLTRQHVSVDRKSHRRVGVAETFGPDARILSVETNGEEVVVLLNRVGAGLRAGGGEVWMAELPTVVGL